MGKRVVITVHGIRTRGAWQKQLTPILAKHELIPYPLDYGRFSAMSFLIPWRRESKLNWFHNEYAARNKLFVHRSLRTVSEHI